MKTCYFYDVFVNSRQ